MSQEQDHYAEEEGELMFQDAPSEVVERMLTLPKKKAYIGPVRFPIHDIGYERVIHPT